MSKDPAFLFYSSDFLTGTMTMSNEQVGKYIRLLCLQHQKGILTEKDMFFICVTYDEDIWSKFIKEDDVFYNERLRFEAEKRAKYSLSRSSNRANKNKKPLKKHMKKICKSYVEHMENENENENINKTKEKRRSKTVIPDDFKISDRVKRWAEEKGYLRIDEHLESFKLKCRSKDYAYVDWDAAFMNAIRDNWANIGNGGPPAREPPKAVIACPNCGARVSRSDIENGKCWECRNGKTSEVSAH